MTQGLSRTVAALLGGAVCVSLVNIVGTILFNAETYILLGSGIPVAEAFARVRGDWSTAIGVGASVVAAIFGGYTAAALSRYQPYLSAALSGGVLVLWYVVMLATPLQIGPYDRWSYVSWFVIPIPGALFGARLRKHLTRLDGDG